MVTSVFLPEKKWPIGTRRYEFSDKRIPKDT